MGAKSVRKGKKEERVFANMLQEHGFAATRIHNQGARRPGDPGGDVFWPILGRDRRVESKCKAQGGGFKGLYGWLETVDIGRVRMDDKPALVVMREDFFLEVAKMAEKNRAPRAGELSEKAAREIAGELSSDDLPVIDWAEIRAQN